MWKWGEIQPYHREFGALLCCSTDENKKINRTMYAIQIILKHEFIYC